MSEIKLPKDFIFDEEEEIIEEVPKELEEGTLPEEAKPVPEEEGFLSLVMLFLQTVKQAQFQKKL